MGGRGIHNIQAVVNRWFSVLNFDLRTPIKLYSSISNEPSEYLKSQYDSWRLMSYDESHPISYSVLTTIVIAVHSCYFFLLQNFP